MLKYLDRIYWIYVISKIDDLVISPKTVMPDVIRHPEHIENTGFRLSPE